MTAEQEKQNLSIWSETILIWAGRGVTLKCDKPCIVLSGSNWDVALKNTHSSVVFVEESTSFLSSAAFAKAVKNSDNYYVFVTREPLPQIPYSIDSVKQIVKNGRMPKFEKIYQNISVKDISAFPYDAVIVEDSAAGYIFFSSVSNKHGVRCISSAGKSRLLTMLKESKAKRILMIADAAALGSEIKELMAFRELTGKQIDFFLPESFEWLVLRSAIFDSNNHVKTILTNPVDFIESSEYFSWERFFTYLLSEETRDRPQLRYPKNKSRLPRGYQTDANMESILNAMK